MLANYHLFRAGRQFFSACVARRQSAATLLVPSGIADKALSLAAAAICPHAAGQSCVLMWSPSAPNGCDIGGIPQTQEMLDFCGKHNIPADVEVIPIQKVNDACERLPRSDAKYRFCIDMASLRSD